MFWVLPRSRCRVRETPATSCGSKTSWAALPSPRYCTKPPPTPSPFLPHRPWTRTPRPPPLTPKESPWTHRLRKLSSSWPERETDSYGGTPPLKNGGNYSRRPSSFFVGPLFRGTSPTSSPEYSPFGSSKQPTVRRCWLRSLLLLRSKDSKLPSKSWSRWGSWWLNLPSRNESYSGGAGEGDWFVGGGNVLFVLSKLCKFISQGVLSKLCNYRFSHRPDASTGNPTLVSPDNGVSVVHVGRPAHWNRVKCDTLILPPIMVATAAQDVTPELPGISEVKGWL
jgi:hypothetical protein